VINYLKKLKIILQSNLFYIIIIILTIFYVFFYVKIIKYESVYTKDENEFIGKVLKINKTDYGYSVTIESLEKLIVYIDEFNYQLGDTILVKGALNIPKENTVLNNFNYKEYLYQNKIFYTIEASKIELIKENNNLIYKLKNSLLKYMDTYKSNIYLKSFILSDTSYLEDDVYNSYQINGVCHLLSIGSCHITFLSIFILFILKKLKVNEVISHIVLFIIIMLFIILTDYPISIIRVYLYLILSFLNKKLKINLNPIKLFTLTLIITLLINPFYIYHKGFLYSYSISFILILNKDKLTGSYLTKLIKISFISFLYSIPFNIYFNYSINILSIIYNLFYVPFFNIIICPFSLLTLIFKFLDNIFLEIINISNNISYLLNNYTWAIFIFKKVSFIVLILYLLLITLVIKDIFNKKIKSFLVLVIVLIIHFHINYLIPRDFFMAIDVSQGDSNLIYSNNKAILIDTGGVFNSQVSDKIITMLKSLGIRSLYSLVLSHGDFDHMGDAINLVNNFKVEKVIFNCGEFNKLEQELINVLDKKKIPYYSCIKELNIDNNKLYFLNNKDYGNENDNSSIIYTELDNYKFLFMGDAGEEVEEDLIERYNLQDIDVLKVGHHGSKTSSSLEFINEINPKYSIISVGKNNRYGHPNKQVLENLKDSKIYRTDEEGSIMFKIRNNRLQVETCSP